MKELQGYVKGSVVVMKPRYLHLQAYFAVVQGRQNKAFRLLKKCLKEADNMGLKCEKSWALQNHAAWTEGRDFRR